MKVAGSRWVGLVFGSLCGCGPLEGATGHAMIRTWERVRR